MVVVTVRLFVRNNVVLVKRIYTKMIAFNLSYQVILYLLEYIIRNMIVFAYDLGTILTFYSICVYNAAG